jgi:hypothetical protein
MVGSSNEVIDGAGLLMIKITFLQLSEFNYL